MSQISRGAIVGWDAIGFSRMADSGSPFRGSLRHEIIGHIGLGTLHSEDKQVILNKIKALDTFAGIDAILPWSFLLLLQLPLNGD